MGFVEQPAVVLALVVGATVLLALSFGVLRKVGVISNAIAFAGLASIGVGSGGLTWWPLLGVVVALGTWAVMIAQSTSPLGRRIFAGLLYAVGAIGFGAANGDAPTLVLADITSLVFPFALPWVMQLASTRLELAPRAGLEKMIGKLGTVSIWSGSSGVVRVDGELWNATGMKKASMLDKILVTDVRGISLVVVPTAPRIEQIDFDDE